MTIGEEIMHRYSSRAKSLAALARIEEALEGLKMLEMDGYYLDFGEIEYVDGQNISGPYVILEPKHLLGIDFGYGELVLVDTTPTLADAAKFLLPKIGRWEKSFDEKNNLIRLTGEFKGVRIVLQDAPPNTCTVRTIEEEVEVPEKIIPAHTEKTIRYVMEGDCDPLMMAHEASSVEPAVVAQEIPQAAQNSLDNDIPF